MKYDFDNPADFYNALGDDAGKWAEAFCERFGTDVIDHALMVSWFANAIEHSYKIRMRSMQAQMRHVSSWRFGAK